MTTQTYMETHETVVLKVDSSIFIVNWRTIERITNALSPMLETGEDIMVIVVVLSSDMVGYRYGMIMVNRTTLIL